MGEAITSLIENESSQGKSILNDLISIPQLEGVVTALNEMHPALYKGLAISQENNIVKVQDNLGSRFQQELNKAYCHPNACKKEPLYLWVNGFGDRLKQKSSYFSESPQLGYQNQTGGVMLGCDGNFADYFYLGALGAYTRTALDWSNTHSEGTIQTGYTGLYFSAVGDMFYGNISVIGAWSQYEGRRNINFSGVDVTATNTHGGSQLLSHIDTGVNLRYKAFTVNLFDSFDYINQTEGSFTEKGAGVYNLHVKKTNPIMLRNQLGLELTRCVCFDSIRWMISPKISWVREIRIKGQSYMSEFEGTGLTFESKGYFPNRNLISFGAKATGITCDDCLDVDLYFNGDFCNDYSDFNLGAQISFRF